MTVTLLMAITTNGFIAGLDDDTNWVKDIEVLNQTIADIGVVVMGRRTYDECMKYDAFPYKDALNIVMTHDADLLSKSADQVMFTDKSPQEVLKIAQAKNFNRVLVIGGGHINGAFFKHHLIDEVVLDIHPLIKAKGIHLFEADFADQELELVDCKPMNDQILQVRYKVKK